MGTRASVYRIGLIAGLLGLATGGCGASYTSGSGGAGGGGYYYDNYGGMGGADYVPPINEGDQYEPVGTNPFVEVSHDPFSTFAADVDTASYDVFRRDVQLGLLPNPDSVRLEEWVNYFAYDYPTPSSDDPDPFAITLAAGPNVLESGTTLLRVGISTAELSPDDVRPANLVFLVDTSGSMSWGGKIDLVQVVLRETLEVLQPTDTVAIVTYAGSTGVALEPTPVSESETILAVIDSFSAGGSTAGASGIELAYQQAEAAFIDGGVNHVLLCTDGDFNVGPSSNDALVTLIEEKRETGITLTVLGFGIGNLNDSMMEAITNAGNGIYAVISSYDQAVEYVYERMLGTIYHVAKDVKIQVELNPDYVYAYRLLGYENRAIADEDFRDDRVDGGEIGAGHRVTALYELVLVGDDLPEGEEAPAIISGDPVDGDRMVAAPSFVRVAVRYKDLDATADDPAYEVSVSLPPIAIAASRDDSDPDLDWAIAVAAFAEILKDSPYARLDALDAIEAIVHGQEARDSERTEFRTLFDAARIMLEGN